MLRYRCVPLALLGAILLLAAGCATPPAEPAPPGEPDPGLCTEPRPQVCTMIYDPVCAERSTGRRETLSSPCNACADDGVIRWTPGRCEEGAEDS